jgi:hypothetical protein
MILDAVTCCVDYSDFLGAQLAVQQATLWRPRRPAPRRPPISRLSSPIRNRLFVRPSDRRRGDRLRLAGGTINAIVRMHRAFWN